VKKTFSPIRASPKEFDYPNERLEIAWQCISTKVFSNDIPVLFGGTKLLPLSPPFFPLSFS